MTRQKYIKEYEYTGNLSEVFSKYVLYKRSLGLILNSDAKKLAHFDKFTFNFKTDPNVLSKELVIAYTSKSINESDGNHVYRINLINRLARFMQQNGYEAHCQPTNITRKTKIEYLPYIFSEDEIARIFNVADMIKSSPKHRNYHLVVPLMFKILYSCGLRVSELTHLTVEDVDLELGVLKIYNTKFGKDRLVPMSESILSQCRSYSSKIHLLSNKGFPYFPNARNHFFSSKRVYDLFRQIIQRAGISHRGVGKGPRLHDLRHTFAVHSLKQLTLQGFDLTVALPYLSAYLGHTGLKSTQRYLRLTTDLYPNIIAKLIDQCSDMIPELGGDLYE